MGSIRTAGLRSRRTKTNVGSCLRKCLRADNACSLELAPLATSVQSWISCYDTLIFLSNSSQSAFH